MIWPVLLCYELLYGMAVLLCYELLYGMTYTAML